MQTRLCYVSSVLKHNHSALHHTVTMMRSTAFIPGTQIFTVDIICTGIIIYLKNRFILAAYKTQSMAMLRVLLPITSHTVHRLFIVTDSSHLTHVIAAKILNHARIRCFSALLTINRFLSVSRLFWGFQSSRRTGGHYQ